MAIFFIPLEDSQQKLYQREKESTGFADITEEQLAELAKRIYIKNELTEENTKNIINPKLEKYQEVLQYLTSQGIHMDIKTFDERMAFLIMTVDPNLITFKEFLKLDLQTIEEISKVENKKERTRLFDERNAMIANYETSVRRQIGFYDKKLLKYEELFFKRFFNNRELITDVNQHNEASFLILGKIITSFKKVSDERYKELEELAKIWLSLVPDKYRSKIATYSVNNQRELLGIKTLQERFVFFILITDGNLDMLRIYEEESMMDKVEERIIAEFGFFDKEMLTLERKFHERFCPDKKLSIWSEHK